MVISLVSVNFVSCIVVVVVAEVSEIVLVVIVVVVVSMVVVVAILPPNSAEELSIREEFGDLKISGQDVNTEYSPVALPTTLTRPGRGNCDTHMHT